MSKSDTDVHATISISDIQYPEFVTKFILTRKTVYHFWISKKSFRGGNRPKKRLAITFKHLAITFELI